MQNDLLSHFEKKHAQNLHARGAFGTKVLAGMLGCQPGEHILEIGFGTGATLVRLCAVHKQTHFYGVEASAGMLRKATARLRFAGLGERVKLGLFEKNGRIPHPDGTFDKVYLESVLGIQENGGLEALLREIQRVLKPDGLLIANETIWLDSTPLDEIKRINAACKQAFGIIQSNELHPYFQDWKALFTRLGFEWISEVKLHAMKDDFPRTVPGLHQLLSAVFTLLGKTRAFLSPGMRRKTALYFQKMKAIIPQDQRLMEGVVIVARRLK